MYRKGSRKSRKSRKVVKSRKHTKSVKSKTSRRKNNVQSGGGNRDWEIPSYSTVVWRDRSGDKYAPYIVTSKEDEINMTEND